MQENISVTDSYSTGNAAQAMLEKLLQIYDVKTLVAQLNGVGENHWSAAILKRALANDSAWHRLSEKEFAHLQTLLPKPPAHHPHYAFRFIDLFAGIGGIRRGFESIGGQCVFTSEWNKHAVRTYKANHYCDPATHHFNEDIRDITLSHKEGVSDEAAAEHIRQHIPEHDVLLAGFPCQPFSLAGVSKKNSLGRAHGFACDTQGTLFFDVVRIIDARRPAMFVLENVKNLKNNGNKYGDDFWNKRQRHFVDLGGGLQNTDDKARDQRHQQQRGSQCQRDFHRFSPHHHDRFRCHFASLAVKALRQRTDQQLPAIHQYKQHQFKGQSNGGGGNHHHP